jgi:signal transduction histidine kinase
MLGNLLGNACRSARGVVTVKATRDWPRLRITVHDDGPGTKPDQPAAVLQRGVHLDQTRGGGGLGLAIVVKLARLYGGELTLAAAEPGGLSVRLSLPASVTWRRTGKTHPKRIARLRLAAEQVWRSAQRGDCAGADAMS